jgi:peptidylprolyl isomerase
MRDNGCCSSYGGQEKKGAELRTALSLVVVLGLVGSLAACSSAANDAGSECTPTKSGAASQSVKVTGDFGSKPTVKIKDPLTAKSTQRTVVIDGDGTVAKAGYDITAEFSVYNGSTGKLIDATDYAKAPVAWTLDKNLIAGFTKTLECSTEGSRVVGVIAPKDGIAAEGLESLGLTKDDSLVVVADLLTADKATKALPKATGDAKKLPDTFPAIDLKVADDESGTPTVTLPGGAAPADLQIATTIKGKGAKVADGASVTVNYQGLNWRTGEIFDQSWGKAPATFVTSQVVAGFGQALVGQTVGSQVVVVIPPALGYGPQGGNEQAGITADDTLVFVIDILASKG